MTIYVTEKDIKQGVCHEPSACAVARAIAKATGEVWYLSTRYAFTERAPTTLYAIPEDVRAKMADLDNARPCAPFTFEWPWPTL